MDATRRERKSIVAVRVGASAGLWDHSLMRSSRSKDDKHLDVVAGVKAMADSGKRWLCATKTTDKNLFDQQEINGYQMSQRATKKAAKKDHNAGG